MCNKWDIIYKCGHAQSQDDELCVSAQRSGLRCNVYYEFKFHYAPGKCSDCSQKQREDKRKDDRDHYYHHYCCGDRKPPRCKSVMGRRTEK